MTSMAKVTRMTITVLYVPRGERMPSEKALRLLAAHDREVERASETARVQNLA